MVYKPNHGVVFLIEGKNDPVKVCPRIFFIIPLLSLWVFWPLAGPGAAHFLTKPLTTAFADAGRVKGSFTVIFYGGAYADDMETVAFLDIEGDSYTLEPFAPDFDYVRDSGIPAEDAILRAETFISFHASFWKTQLAEIIGPAGGVIGYELKPLYLPFIYGTSDVLDISYWPKKDGKIKVTITLIPWIKSLKFHPGGDSGLGGIH